MGSYQRSHFQGCKGCMYANSQSDECRGGCVNSWNDDWPNSLWIRPLTGLSHAEAWEYKGDNLQFLATKFTCVKIATFEVSHHIHKISKAEKASSLFQENRFDVMIV